MLDHICFFVLIATGTYMLPYVAYLLCDPM